MSRLLLATALALAAAGPLAAQSLIVPKEPGGSPVLAALESAYRVDFAIPDAPAFQLLGTEPSDILRPASVQQLAVAASRFRGDGGGLTIPRAFAVEFSPALLVDITRESYARAKALYGTRISVATRTDSVTGSPAQLALGLRTSIVDEASMTLDAAAVEALRITPLLETIRDVYSTARDRVGPTKPLVLSPDEKARIDDLSEQIRERWAERHWNARAIDVAVGLLASAADAEGRDPEVTRLGLWGTYADGWGDWGHLLVGARVGASRNGSAADFAQDAMLGARLYVGANRYKAFIELQDSFTEGGGTDLLLNSGAELRLADSIWSSFSAGIRWDGDDRERRAVSSLKLKLGLPAL